MIDRWWSNWEGLGRFESERSYWCGSFDSEDEEVLYYGGGDGYWWLGEGKRIHPIRKAAHAAWNGCL
jgi:hypothetical protein